MSTNHPKSSESHTVELSCAIWPDDYKYNDEDLCYRLAAQVSPFRLWHFLPGYHYALFGCALLLWFALCALGSVACLAACICCLRIALTAWIYPSWVALAARAAHIPCNSCSQLTLCAHNSAFVLAALALLLRLCCNLHTVLAPSCHCPCRRRCAVALPPPLPLSPLPCCRSPATLLPRHSTAKVPPLPPPPLLCCSAAATKLPPLRRLRQAATTASRHRHHQAATKAAALPPPLPFCHRCCHGPTAAAAATLLPPSLLMRCHAASTTKLPPPLPSCHHHHTAKCRTACAMLQQLPAATAAARLTPLLPPYCCHCRRRQAATLPMPPSCRHRHRHRAAAATVLPPSCCRHRRHCHTVAATKLLPLSPPPC